MEQFFFYDSQLYRQRRSGGFDRHLGGQWQPAKGDLSLSEEEFEHLRQISSTVADWLIAWGGWRGNVRSLVDYVAELEAAGLRPGEVEPPPPFSMSPKA